MNLEDRLRKALAEAKPRSIQSTLFNMAHAYDRTAREALESLERSRDADFAGPAVVCRAFALELLLKFFIASGHPTLSWFEDLKAARVNLRGHDLPELWDRCGPAFGTAP